MASNDDFVTRWREVVTRFLEAAGDANELMAHYQAMGYSSAADFEGESFEALHPDIDGAQVVAAVGSMDALNTFLAAGHRTNLERVRRL